MGQNYDAKSLTILHGLEPVRERPGMYIGSTSTLGLHHLVWEIVDNAVDEANEGYGKNITVTICLDGSLMVEDQGRGVPYDYNAKEKMTGFQIVYQTLHGGGKFDESNYRSAGGLHGVGASVTNALSEWMEVHSYRDGIDHFARFEKGGSKFSGIKELGKTSKRGTSVRFMPDKTIFDDIVFDFDRIANHLDDQACLTKGVVFHLRDERTSRSKDFFYQDGLVEYFNRHTYNKVPLTKPMHFEGEDSQIKVDLVFGFMKDSYDEKIIAFANGVRTGDGGYHVTGLKKAITSCYNNYGINNGLFKATSPLDGECLREGLVAILSVWVPEHLLQFEGQTKGKLGTKEALNATDSVIESKLSYYLVENKQEAEAVIKKTMNEMKARDKAEQERKKERELLKNNMAGFELSNKLTPCSSKDYMKNELFIVEGDSAGGSAKKGRDPKYQAILPLRGKPKNTTEVEDEKVLFGNKEIFTLITTIGAGYGKEFKIRDIHYGKIIIMTDADDDGSHIQSLLLTFFYNHMKPLIENGNLYIACPPLYRVYNNKKEIYCYDDTELEKAKAQIGAGYKVNRYKGLGEMNYTQLSETTMSREHRKLLRVVLKDDEDTSDKVSLFLGNNADRRKEWINNNIDFTTVDNFIKEVERNEK
ncbi:MAG: DNA topoisomerase IV subunit B [Candidatus Enterosoma sp.]|nr:DNA topoisomerase IV subunit B [bacterium]MDY4188532.1 DNA topoisomerase IV subunit B [Candidatus Enterosoma sp.]MDD7618053.1 DNA topoisomerase IV subunit B [bacterium]MDY4549565.1 DNA topoisomerase IV subunit B [Candidatus Enterosoma sp.]MDY5256642.1 DNA topoisomerase IV subunit B [Candidatus Enterosoma sp.]